MFGSESSKSWRGRLRSVFGVSAKDALTAEELSTLLFEADLSAPIVEKLVLAATKTKSQGRAIQHSVLVSELTNVMDTVKKPVSEVPLPGAVLLVGVNGAGKTTVCAKLAKFYLNEKKKVLLAAADTFRAGAIDQLKVWGDRLGVEVVAQKQGADPGAVVFDAWQKAVAQNAIMIADTAGRLHNKQPLVEELKKIVRILSKDGRGAPHECYLVLDGTVGQNALAQSREFLKAAPLTGLIVTKLDGTAKGGGALSSSLESKLPIRYIGIGEKFEDLVPFDAGKYAEELFRQ